jgi:plastocyanin
MKKVSFIILFFVFSLTCSGTTFTISTSGFAFSPASTTINLGDIVNFSLAGTNHDAVEVSLATYNANGTTPLAGGFSFGIGVSGTVPAAKLTVGTHYFICTPHIGFGMKGTIIVNNSGCTPPSAPVSIAGNTVACSNSINAYSVTSVSGATDYTWTLPSGWTGSSTTNTINVTSGISGGAITVTANSACGNSSPTTLNVSITSVPQKPAAISGANAICINSSNLYSISSVPGATSYSWTLPSGWTGTSNSNSITTQANSTSGNILVTANNICGVSSSQSISISVSGPPNQPGIISGNNAVCSGSANVYSVTAVPGATSYTWSLPSEWNGTSTTNSINVTAGSAGGTLSVVSNGICGASASRALAVTISSSPGQPSGISGNSTICANSINTYSVPLVAGATSYSWTLPGGWTGTSATNSITVTSSSGGGNISVAATNSCGNSSPQNLAIAVNSIPLQPGTISGNLNVCANSSNTYSIVAVPGATSYSWTLPTGWTGNSSSNSITVNAGTTGGAIKVSANNTCGNSVVSTLNVTTLAPQAPAAITGKNSICGNSSNIYSVPEVSGATSYTWVLPFGWTGSSTTNTITAIAGTSGGNITVAANNTCGSSTVQTLGVSVGNIPALPGVISGQNNICGNSTNQYTISQVPEATSYTWTLPNGWTGNSNTNIISAVSGLSGGNITVMANNACGSSGKQIFSASVINPPVQPGIISGNATICEKSTYSYTVIEVSGATSYSWTLPSGWTGTSTTNSILVLGGSSAGNVTVSAKNQCGLSTPQTLGVNVNKVPDAPASITGNGSVCAGSSNTYTVTSVNGALSYTWVLPNGWSGTSTTNSINVIAGQTGGTINVTANNACGQSTPVAFNVSTIAPPSPASISGNNNVCINSNNTYTVQAVAGATSYTWNLPGDWTGTSSTNSINALSGATSGNVTVTANNSCGASLPQTLAVNVKPVPATPSAITGLSLICPNSINTL